MICCFYTIHIWQAVIWKPRCGVCVCVGGWVGACSVLSNSLSTVALQVSLSVGFCRQEYWSGLPFLPPGNLPDPGIQPVPYISCTGRLILYHLCHLGSHNTGCFWGSKWSHLHSLRHCLFPSLGRDETQIPRDLFRQSFSSFLMDLNNIPFWIKGWQCFRVFPHPSSVRHEYSINVPYIKNPCEAAQNFSVPTLHSLSFKSLMMGLCESDFSTLSFASS